MAFEVRWSAAARAGSQSKRPGDHPAPAGNRKKNETGAPRTATAHPHSGASDGSGGPLRVRLPLC